MDELFEALKESWRERGELIKLLSEGRLDEAKQFIDLENNCFQRLEEKNATDQKRKD